MNRGPLSPLPLAHNRDACTPYLSSPYSPPVLSPYTEPFQSVMGDQASVFVCVRCGVKTLLKELLFVGYGATILSLYNQATLGDLADNYDLHEALAIHIE